MAFHSEPKLSARGCAGVAQLSSISLCISAPVFRYFYSSLETLTSCFFIFYFCQHFAPDFSHQETWSSVFPCSINHEFRLTGMWVYRVLCIRFMLPWASGSLNNQLGSPSNPCFRRSSACSFPGANQDPPFSYKTTRRPHHSAPFPTSWPRVYLISIRFCLASVRV